MSVEAAAARVFSVLHSIPLWIFMGLAVAAWAVIFVPSFGGVDLTGLRNVWGPWFLVGAITFSVLSAASAIDLILKRWTARRQRRRYREQNRYFKIYAPLFAQLVTIQIIRVPGRIIPLSERIAYAWSRLQSIKKRRGTIKAVWKALFNRREGGTTGKIDHGGTFPIKGIERQVHANLEFCDDELLNLVGRAIDTRIDDYASPDELTSDDIRLCDHVMDQRNYLKKLIER
jgi:hypothetical protein